MFGGRDWDDGMIEVWRKREVGAGADWRSCCHQGDCELIIYTSLRESARH